MSHPADVVAASRGILTSNLARERRYRRAHGMVLELRSLREQLQEWPGEELNTIRGALLEILEAVEEELQRGIPRFRRQRWRKPLTLGGTTLRGKRGGYMNVIMAWETLQEVTSAAPLRSF